MCLIYDHIKTVTTRTSNLSRLTELGKDNTPLVLYKVYINRGEYLSSPHYSNRPCGHILDTVVVSQLTISDEEFKKATFQCV